MYGLIVDTVIVDAYGIFEAFAATTDYSPFVKLMAALF